MCEKKAPEGAIKKPLFYYSLEEKIVNNTLCREEQGEIINCLKYGDFTRSSDEFAIKRHGFIYSSLQAYFNNRSDFSCNSFIEYLQESPTNDLEKCGGQEYISNLFNTIYIEGAAQW